MSSVLCVDDDQIGLKIRSLVLQSFGFEVHGTTDPEAAMRLLRDRTFDIVVVDYFLPNTTGTALAKAMKLLRPSLLVLLLSGSVDAPIGLDHVNGFLCKTGSPQLLATTIRDLLAKHHSQAA